MPTLMYKHYTLTKLLKRREIFVLFINFVCFFHSYVYIYIYIYIYMLYIYIPICL